MELDHPHVIKVLEYIVGEHALVYFVFRGYYRGTNNFIRGFFFVVIETLSTAVYWLVAMATLTFNKGK